MNKNQAVAELLAIVASMLETDTNSRAYHARELRRLSEATAVDRLAGVSQETLSDGGSLLLSTIKRIVK